MDINITPNDAPLAHRMRLTEPGDEGIVKILKDLHSWQFIWARVVARVWSGTADKEWEAKLFSGDEALVAQAFLEVGYTLPPGFKLVVERADESSQYDEEAYRRSPPVNGWKGQEKLLGASVKMYVPNPPKSPELQALALTDYNANGQNYPFTF